MKNKIKVFLLIAGMMTANSTLTTFAAQPADTYLSQDIIEQCILAEEEYGISCEYLESLIEAESSGKMSAENGPCYGICQINSDVWGTSYDTEEKQIQKACELLTSYLEDVDDMVYALARYNGQSNALEKYESGQLLENTYIKKVMCRAEELTKLHSNEISNGNRRGEVSHGISKNGDKRFQRYQES